MPPTKEQIAKHSFSRSFSTSEMTNSARVYHPATNLMPHTPPTSPTGVAPNFPSRPPSTWGRQTSSNGKYH